MYLALVISSNSTFNIVAYQRNRSVYHCTAVTITLTGWPTCKFTDSMDWE